MKCKLNCTRDDDVSIKLEEKHSVWLSEGMINACHCDTCIIAAYAYMIIAQEPRLEFSKTMSNDEFMDYLKNKGLPERDCSKLTGIVVIILLVQTADCLNTCIILALQIMVSEQTYSQS